MKGIINLSEEDVKQAIGSYLASKGYAVTKVSIDVSKQLVGHYTNERYEAVFNGAKVEVEFE